MEIKIDSKKLEEFIQAQNDYSQRCAEFNAYLLDIVMHSTEENH